MPDQPAHCVTNPTLAQARTLTRGDTLTVSRGRTRVETTVTAIETQTDTTVCVICSDGTTEYTYRIDEYSSRFAARGAH